MCLVRRQVPGKGRLVFRKFKGDAVNGYSKPRPFSLQQTKLDVVVRDLAGGSHCRQSEQRSQGLIEPSAILGLGLDGSRVGIHGRAVNLDDKYTLDLAPRSRKSLIEPFDQSGHTVVVVISAVHDVRLRAGAV